MKDCLFLSKQKLKKAEKKTKGSVSQTQILKAKSVSSKAVKKDDKVVKVLKKNPDHNISFKQTIQPKMVWKAKRLTKEVLAHCNDSPTTSTDFKKNSKLVDVIIVDDAGRPKTVKAWVTLSN